MIKYPRTYRLLKSAGHSPSKAAEIIIDAIRGNPWAIYWIRTSFLLRHSK